MRRHLRQTANTPLHDRSRVKHESECIQAGDAVAANKTIKKMYNEAMTRTDHRKKNMKFNIRTRLNVYDSKGTELSVDSTVNEIAISHHIACIRTQHEHYSFIFQYPRTHRAELSWNAAEHSTKHISLTAVVSAQRSVRPKTDFYWYENCQMTKAIAQWEMGTRMRHAPCSPKRCQIYSMKPLIPHTHNAKCFRIEAPELSVCNQ